MRYSRGEGVPRNPVRAVFWLRKALGDPDVEETLRTLLRDSPQSWSQSLFPQALSSVLADGFTLGLTTNGLRLRLVSVHFEVGNWGVVSNAQLCGLIIREAGRPAQGIGTYGDWNQVVEMESCERLVDAGAMPPSDGAPRIGLLYDVVGLTGPERRAMVLVREAVTGHWRIDDTASAAVDEGPEPPTLAWMRQTLRQGR